METRRIEGVILEAAREQSQGIQAQKTGELLQIKLISQVPQVLLESLKDKETFRAIVMEVSQGKVRLFLDNGYEILAENNMSVALQKEDRLELSIKDYNPLTFRVTKLESNLRHQVLLETIFEGKGPILYTSENIEEGVYSSGILYERKLFEFFTGKLRLEDLLSDTKAQVLREIAQWVNVEGMDNAQLVSYLRHTLSNLQKTYGDVKLLLSALDTLTLKSLSHDEYVKVIKHLKESPLLGYLELGQEDKVFQELLKVIDEKENFPLRDKFVKALSDLKLLSDNAKDQELKSLVENLLKNQEGIDRLRTFAKEILNTPLMKNLSTFQELVLSFEYIVAAQHALLKSNRLFLPISYEGAKGGVVFDIKDDYRVLINLNYPGYYISALITSPKVERTSSIKVKISTDNQQIAELLSNNETLLRELLAQEGINLSGFYVNVVERGEYMEEAIKLIDGEGFHLAV